MSIVLTPTTAIAPVPAYAQPIIRVPMNQAFPQLGEVREFANKVCLFSHDRSQLFDVVSPRYNVMEHGRAVVAIEDALVRQFGKGAAPKLNVRTFKDGARMVATAELPIPHVKLAVGDVTALSITVRNSYDRSCGFSATGSGRRLVCTNGMSFGKAFGAVSARHITSAYDAEEENGMGDAIFDQLGVIIARMPLVKERWERWVQERITREQAETMVAGWLPAKYSEPLLDTAKWVRGQTMWDWYNSLTHMSSHLTESVQRRVQFDETISRLFYTDDEESEYVDSMAEA